jgi:hypothetical protein
MDRVSVKYTIIFHFKTLQNLPKFVFFGTKTNHLATLKQTEKNVPFRLLFFFFVGGKKRLLIQLASLSLDLRRADETNFGK